MEDTLLQDNIKNTLNFLKNKKKILFITTSNRPGVAWVWEKPKSSKIAYFLQEKLWSDKVSILDINSLKIYNCEGHISGRLWNTCWIKNCVLKDSEKNPSGYHRCLISLTKPDDELWKISKALFESDAVVFFGSTRRGQSNALYQKLIERLSWIENRHSNLGEDCIIGNISAGIIFLGHDWNWKNVVETQKEVFGFYGFHVPNELSWNWQYMQVDSTSEEDESYKNDAKTFEESLAGMNI